MHRVGHFSRPAYADSVFSSRSRTSLRGQKRLLSRPRLKVRMYGMLPIARAFVQISRCGLLKIWACPLSTVRLFLPPRRLIHRNGGICGAGSILAVLECCDARPLSSTANGSKRMRPPQHSVGKTSQAARRPFFEAGPRRRVAIHWFGCTGRVQISAKKVVRHST
jgi:hypothetical protein